MEIDLNKLPSRERLTEMLSAQVRLPYAKKNSLTLIAEIDAEPLGHCNVNDITF